MSQRNVELVIGRLVTDEELRLRLTRSPLETLNFYSPPAYRANGDELPRAKP